MLECYILQAVTFCLQEFLLHYSTLNGGAILANDASNITLAGNSVLITKLHKVEGLGILALIVISLWRKML